MSEEASTSPGKAGAICRTVQFLKLVPSSVVEIEWKIQTMVGKWINRKWKSLGLEIQEIDGFTDTKSSHRITPKLGPQSKLARIHNEIFY